MKDSSLVQEEISVRTRAGKRSHRIPRLLAACGVVLGMMTAISHAQDVSIVQAIDPAAVEVTPPVEQEQFNVPQFPLFDEVAAKLFDAFALTPTTAAGSRLGFFRQSMEAPDGWKVAIVADPTASTNVVNTFTVHGDYSAAADYIEQLPDDTTVTVRTSFVSVTSSVNGQSEVAFVGLRTKIFRRPPGSLVTADTLVHDVIVPVAVVASEPEGDIAAAKYADTLVRAPEPGGGGNPVPCFTPFPPGGTPCQECYNARALADCAAVNQHRADTGVCMRNFVIAGAFCAGVMIWTGPGAAVCLIADTAALMLCYSDALNALETSRNQNQINFNLCAAVHCPPPVVPN